MCRTPIWARFAAGLLAGALWGCSWGCSTSGLDAARADARPPVEEAAWRAALAADLRSDVDTLAGSYPGRHVARLRMLEGAAAWIEDRLVALGLEPIAERYRVPFRGRTVDVRNIIAEVPGTAAAERVIVIGAHYDTEPQTPGADDNASGVAVGLALASYFRSRPQPVTLRFVFYTNEEQPFSWGEHMGSLVRARNAKDGGDDVVAMLALEMLGYYSDGPVRPEVARLTAALGIETPADENFVAIAAWPVSAALVRRVHEVWDGAVPSVPVVGPASLVSIGASDHWSYWQVAYPAAMVTDTAYFRNPNYHKPTDTADTLDYQRMAAVTDSVRGVIAALAADPPAHTVQFEEVEIANTGSGTVEIRCAAANAPEQRVTLAPGETRRLRVPRLTPIWTETHGIWIIGTDAAGDPTYVTDGPNGRVSHTLFAADPLVVGGVSVRLVGAAGR